ncbi:hypothetical protein O0L34_g154 [Tuta absoluta]|nr:hypothetical protein O0L34_g154 [Tuta absoluta]
MSAQSDFREQLIDEVKRFPVLYDTRHEHHRDNEVRDSCWAQIAATLDTSSEVLKREWKILRDSLRQSLRNSRGNTKAGLPTKKWRFQTRMSFLVPHMTKRVRASNSLRNVKLDLDAEPAPDPEAEEYEPWSAAAGEPHASAADTDALELFFASVCASARRLPTPQRRQLKRLVLDALLRCEADAEL